MAEKIVFPMEEMRVQNTTMGVTERQNALIIEPNFVRMVLTGIYFAFCLDAICSNSISIRTYLRVKLKDTVTISLSFPP